MMAAIRGAKLSYLLKNFASTFINESSNFYKYRQALFHCSSFLSDQGQEIKMPSLSPTMAEGKIVKWLKKEGDIINPGDVLCDIETDKAIVSMEIEEEGILAKIIIPENTPNIKVGSLIALMVSEGEDWKNVKIPAKAEMSHSNGLSSSVLASEGESVDQEKIVTGTSFPVKMPSLSPTMTSGTIVKWLKKEGDKVELGDILCDIQTDKAIMAMEAEEEGILAKIIFNDDSKDVKVGTLIAVIVPETEDWQNVVVSSGQKEVSESQSISSETARTVELRGKTFGPAVKALLFTYELNPDLIKPTGRGNRLLKEDVLKYITDNKLDKKPPKTIPAPVKSIQKPEGIVDKKHKSALSSHPAYKDIQLSNMRQIIAKRLVQSKQEIPHFYSTAKCHANNLIKAKKDLSSVDINVSMNDLLTKAVALTLQMYPKANALYINNEIKLSETIDICVAVATDTGLYTPIVKAANRKNVLEVSQEIKELAAKAKEGKLKPEEFQGGTFTISNLGMFGITQFRAIINPPQCGILAVGGIIESLRPDMSVEKHMILNLSCDRRVLEEQEAAEFMEILKYFIENPSLITLGVNQSVDMRL